VPSAEVPEWARGVVEVIGQISCLQHEISALRAAREEDDKQQEGSEPAERIPDPDYDAPAAASNEVEEDLGPIVGCGNGTVFDEFQLRMPGLLEVEGSFPVEDSVLESVKATHPDTGLQALLLSQFTEGVNSAQSIETDKALINQRIAAEETSIELDRLRLATIGQQSDAFARFIDRMEKGLLNLGSNWGGGSSAGVSPSPRSPKKDSPEATTERKSVLNPEGRRRKRDKAKAAAAVRINAQENLDEAFLNWQKYRDFKWSQAELMTLAVDQYNLNSSLWFYTWMEWMEEGGDSDKEDNEGTTTKESASKEKKPTSEPIGRPPKVATSKSKPTTTEGPRSPTGSRPNSSSGPRSPPGSRPNSSSSSKRQSSPGAASAPKKEAGATRTPSDRQSRIAERTKATTGTRRPAGATTTTRPPSATSTSGRGKSPASAIRKSSIDASVKK